MLNPEKNFYYGDILYLFTKIDYSTSFEEQRKSLNIVYGID